MIWPANFRLAPWGFKSSKKPSKNMASELKMITRRVPILSGSEGTSHRRLAVDTTTKAAAKATPPNREIDPWCVWWKNRV
jgi:hypothetical protein